MEKDLAEGKIGDKGAYDVEFKGGKLVGKVDFEFVSGVKAGIYAEFGADAVIDALAKAIPGQMDDALLNMLKGALK